MWDAIKRWRWTLLITAVLLAGLLYAFWPTALAVDTARVTEGPLKVTVTDKGVTRARDVFVVSAPVSGYLSRIGLKAGDSVQRGLVIATMTARLSAPLDQRSAAELRGTLAAAEASAAGAAATVGLARRDLARAEAVAAKGFLPRAQLEASRTRVTTAEATLSQSRAEATRIRAMLVQPTSPGSGRAVPVLAPASGAVLTVINDSAGAVAEGTPLMTIGDPRTIELVVELLSRDAVKVRPGDKVNINEWGGPDPLVGTVTKVEPYGHLKVSALGIEEQRVNVIVSFDESSAAKALRLGHGYQVEASVLLWSASKVMRLPIGALFRGADGTWHVFVNDHGRARERRVQIGHINDEYAEVVHGVSGVERVVLNPSASLGDGARISSR